MSAASSMAGHTFYLYAKPNFGGGNLMIHHAMWIRTQAVILCAAFDADSKSNESK